MVNGNANDHIFMGVIVLKEATGGYSDSYRSINSSHQSLLDNTFYPPVCSTQKYTYPPL